jgi:two-component system, LytTR family, sensor histidine kinase AgrC
MLINNQKRLNEISQYNKKLESLTNEMKKFRHDYKNIMLSMNGYLIENDIEGLKNFFYSNIDPSSKVLDLYNLNISSIANINCVEVKGIILSKIIKAEDISIDTKVYIPDIIEYINFNCLDLCRVLGIILDNCIEASSECESPSIEISITQNDKCVSIITTNTYINKGKDISKFFKEGFSTKGDGRGIGLSNLKGILSNYDNAYFTIKAEDEFIQKLDIYN